MVGLEKSQSRKLHVIGGEVGCDEAEASMASGSLLVGDALRDNRRSWGTVEFDLGRALAGDWEADDCLRLPECLKQCVLIQKSRNCSSLWKLSESALGQFP